MQHSQDITVLSHRQDTVQEALHLLHRLLLRALLPVTIAQKVPLRQVIIDLKALLRQRSIIQDLHQRVVVVVVVIMEVVTILAAIILQNVSIILWLSRNLLLTGCPKFEQYHWDIRNFAHFRALVRNCHCFVLFFFLKRYYKTKNTLWHFSLFYKIALLEF